MDKMLHRIHKIPFCTAKNNYGKEQSNKHEDGAIK